MNLEFFKKNRYGLAIVFFTWLAFFLPILSGKFVYFLDDLKIIYFPIETLYAQFQHNWQLPLWANEFGFGQPLLAWGQLGFFTPLHLIMRALYVPPLALLQISVVAYFLLGSIGMVRISHTQKSSSDSGNARSYCFCILRIFYRAFKPCKFLYEHHAAAMAADCN